MISKGLRREKEQKKPDEEISNVESKIIRMGGVDYHKTLCYHQLKGLNQSRKPIKTEKGYHLTRAHIKRE